MSEYKHKSDLMYSKHPFVHWYDGEDMSWGDSQILTLVAVAGKDHSGLCKNRKETKAYKHDVDLLPEEPNDDQSLERVTEIADSYYTFSADAEGGLRKEEAEKEGDEPIELKEYVDRTNEGQNDLYCITGETIAAMSFSPKSKTLRNVQNRNSSYFVERIPNNIMASGCNIPSKGSKMEVYFAGNSTSIQKKVQTCG